MSGKVFHILLAILVFISSSGLVFSKHYCRGELKNIALFTQASSCHVTNKAAVCPRHASAQDTSGEVSANGCCDTATDFLKVDDAQQNSTIEQLPLADAPVLLAVLFSFLPFVEQTADIKTRHLLHYKPPLLVCDLPVSLQTFLC